VTGCSVGAGAHCGYDCTRRKHESSLRGRRGVSRDTTEGSTTRWICNYTMVLSCRVGGKRHLHRTHFSTRYMYPLPTRQLKNPRITECRITCSINYIRLIFRFGITKGGTSYPQTLRISSAGHYVRLLLLALEFGTRRVPELER
jgi:hypothetical protein